MAKTRDTGAVPPPVEEKAIKRQTPHPSVLAPPQNAVRAIDVPGSRRALTSFLTWRARRLAYGLVPIALYVLLLTTDLPGGGKIFFGFVVAPFVAVVVRGLVATWRTWHDMTHLPWRAYRADVLGARSEGATIRLDLSADRTGPRFRLALLRPRKMREHLISGAYAHVWFAGDPGRGGVVVPAGGGELIYGRCLRVPAPRKPRPVKPGRPQKPRQPPKVRTPPKVIKAPKPPRTPPKPPAPAKKPTPLPPPLVRKPRRRSLKGGLPFRDM